MTETESKIVQVIESGDYDLASQLWIGAYPRTGNLAELACIIYNVYCNIKHIDNAHQSFKLNKNIEIITSISGPSKISIKHIKVFYKDRKVWSIINNPHENKDVLHAAINIALNYLIYDDFRSYRLDCGWFISSLVIQGLSNQLEFT